MMTRADIINNQDKNLSKLKLEKMYFQKNFYQSIEDSSALIYSTFIDFDIRSYVKRKEKEINTLDIQISSGDECIGFDYFSKLVKRIPEVKELKIAIDVKLQNEKGKYKSRSKEVLDYLIDEIIPQYQHTLETITFLQLQIQEKSQIDEEKTIKKYLLKILQPLKQLRFVSFRQNLTEIKSSNYFYALKQFLLLIQEKQLNLPSLNFLDFQFKQTENQINRKSFNQKEILNQMLSIAKDLSKINSLEELQIGIQNLGLERNFFDHLMQSIVQMKNLKKLGLDISNNRINVENSIKNIKQLLSLSNQLESFIYIDSQKFKGSSIKELNQVLRNFQNLKFLQIEQFQFKQGLCTDFFSFLSFMPLLEDIRLDLENISLNENDYNYFTKQLKSLTNLTSIQIELPSNEDYELPQYVVNSLIGIITHFKDQLLDFSIVAYSIINADNSKTLIDAISQMEKLKYIYFGFPNKGDCNILQVDSRKYNEENIWNIKSVESIWQNEERFQFLIKFIILLKQMIILKQNPAVLEELKIFQRSVFKSDKDIQMQSDIVELKKFNKLKTLIYQSFAPVQHLVNLAQMLIQNNCNSLTHLELCQAPNIQITRQQMITLVNQCKLLYYLDITIDFADNQFLEQIFNELIFLQKFYIYTNFKASLGSRVFENANYLTDFKCFFTDKFQVMNMINQRKVYILQNIIYTQIIQPQITFQPQFSHLDIVID